MPSAPRIDRRITVPTFSAPRRRVLADAIDWIVVAAIAKSAGALAIGVYAVGASIHVVFVANVLAFGGAGLYLVVAGSHDERARRLGSFFLLIAASFGNGIAARTAAALPVASRMVAALLALHPEAFLPLTLWGFISCFPELRRFDRGEVVEKLFLRWSLVAGTLCFVASLFAVYPAAIPLTGLAAILHRFGWALEPTWYWPLVFGLTLPAFPFGAWKARRAQPAERRRFMVFALALLVGFSPMFVEVLLEAISPGYRAFIAVPSRQAVAASVLYPLMLSIPFTTAYSIRVNHVLDVRLVIRRTVQYALARGTILLAAAVPLVALIVSAVHHRREPLEGLITGSPSASVLTTLVMAIVALGARRPLLNAIDRRFFVHQLDTRKVLQDLAARTSGALSVEQACIAVGNELGAAMHASVASVMIADAAHAALVSPSASTRRLPMTSALTQALKSARRPVPIDLERPAPLVAALPDADKHWLADAQANVVVPLHTGEGFTGVLVLGEKLSGLPFSREDLLDLAPVASALALVVENAQLREGAPERVQSHGVSPGQSVEADRPAYVCGRCLLIATEDACSCAACGGPLQAAELPPLISGKFLLRREIGRGGMGVVYEAFDTSLRRRVAIKALPKVTASQSVRLRREARTMAGFAHPNLAMVFGMESWRGAPAVIMELLEGGTLAARLRNSRMSPSETIRLASALLSAIDLIHEAGLLHRDIKPSNIGYTHNGIPKLLDFGLAQMFEVAVQTSSAPKGQRGSALAGDFTTVSDEATFAGTPGYMPPEAWRGQSLDASADLWSLGVVLCECLTGRNPFRHLSLSGVTARSLAQSVPDIRKEVPDCPEPLAVLVSDLLSFDRRQRPVKAGDVALRLRTCDLNATAPAA